MPSQAQHVRRLAAALAAGPLADREAVLARARPLVGDLRKARWLEPLVRLLCLEFGEAPRPTARRIAERILGHPPFIHAWVAGQGRILPLWIEPQMAAAAGAPRDWQVPPVTTLDGLAGELRLHADDLGWLIARGRAEHYRHRWIEKPKTGRFRLIESPKPLLKLAQRRILRRILGAIPPHEAARGFRAGSSVRDFVAPHAGRELLVRFDLEDFFPSLADSRVLRIFLTAGYPEAVARALTRLTTHAAPPSVLAEKTLAWGERRRLASPHLPQGAPTSPALANLGAFRLDCRLAGLAEAAGANYTRYADDLLFSGDGGFSRQAARFVAAVGAIALEEGLRLNHRKTRVMRQGQRQHAAGLVVNERTTLDRRDFDRLKAILTNCARHGPESQNHGKHPDFAAHLLGKLAWVRFIDPAKGAKLREIFARIDWNQRRGGKALQ
jgi:hypothetical protein